MGDTRRRLPRGRLREGASASAAMVEKVLDAFGRERLLTFGADRVSGTDWVEITHEALIRAWPWLDLTAYRMRPVNRDLYTRLITDADTALSTPLNSGHGAALTVAFSRGGSVLASDDDGAVRLWKHGGPHSSHPTGPTYIRSCPAGQRSGVQR